jgi:Zn-dependent protease
MPDKKVYTSFHDIPPRDYMYFPKGTMDVSKPGNFSRIEIQHLFISIFVLTFAFAFALTPFNFLEGFNINNLVYGLILSFLGISTAFFFHEMSHKFTAQKFGLWAEYRMFPQGLLLASVLGIFTGFVFAAPGAVMFQGGSKNYETGRIAMAGPLSNIIIASVTLFLYLFIFYEIEIIGEIIAFICFINAFLAVFNLLPFGPLDGTKIIRWNATVWVILLIFSILILTQILPKFYFI